MRKKCFFQRTLSHPRWNAQYLHNLIALAGRKASAKSKSTLLLETHLDFMQLRFYVAKAGRHNPEHLHLGPWIILSSKSYGSTSGSFNLRYVYLEGGEMMIQGYISVNSEVLHLLIPPNHSDPFVVSMNMSPRIILEC